MKKYKFFMKLTAILIYVIVIFTFISTGMVFFDRRQNYKDHILASNNQLLSQISNSIDSQLLLSNNVLNQLLEEECMKKYLSESQPDYFNRTQLKSRIQKLIGVYNQNQSDIAVSKLVDNTVIGSQTVADIKEYAADLGITGISAENIKEQFNNGNTNYITLRGETQSATDLKIKNFIIIRKITTLSREQFYAFQSFKEDSLLPKINDNNMFLIINDKGLLTWSGNDNLKSIISHNILISMIVNNNAKTVFELSGHSIIVHHSQYLDWHYVFLVGNDGMSREILKLFVICFLVAILLIVLGSMFAYYLASNIHKPIREIVEGMDIEENSAIDEFSSIKSNTRKIYDTNEKLQTIIKNNHMSLREKFIVDLINGNYLEKDINELAEKYDVLELLSANLTAVYISIMIPDDREMYDYEKMFAIKKELQNDLINSEEYKLAFQPVDAGINSFYIYFTATDQDEIKKYLRNHIVYMEKNYQLNVSASIGGAAEGLRNLPVISRSAKDTFDHAQAIGIKQNVMIADNLKGSQSESYYYPLDLERDIINNLVRGKVELALEIMNNVLKINTVERNLNEQSFSFFVFSIVGTLVRALDVLRYSPNDVFKEGMITYLDLKMCKTLEELKQCLSSAFYSIAEVVNKDSQQTDAEMCRQLLDYIHANYMLDISLTDLAAHFDLSQNYISSLFKSVTKYNFKDYLNSYKVQMGKKIIEENPEIKDSELAELIGCNNQVTLLRLFNKYEGTTPRRYAKNFQNKE